MTSNEDPESVNDRLALEHPSDDYYTRAPLPLRLVEQKRLSIIRRFLGDVRGLEVAEVGSGGGHVLRLFPEARLTAIDVSGVYLEQARRNLAGYDVRFLKGEVDKMDLPAASYDRIICTEVLEHTRDPAAILGAMRRLLRPDGIAVITVPNDPLILRLKAAVRATPAGWLWRSRLNWGGDEYHLHRWTPNAFERLLTPDFVVTERRGAPFDAVPIRACFRCTPRA